MSANDSESLREGEQRIMNVALRTVQQGNGKDNWVFRKGPSCSTQRYAGGKGVKDAHREMKENSLQKAKTRKEAKEQRKVAQGDRRICWTCDDEGHVAASCPRGGNRKLACRVDSEEELQAGARWKTGSMHSGKKVINRRDRPKPKQAAHVSLPRVANNQSSSPKNRNEVKEK